MVYFVSRHVGAILWATKNIQAPVAYITHLDPEIIQKGDIVYGSLPIHIAAEICAKGARFISLVMHIPEELRGKELTADDMNKLSCTVQEYYVEKR